MKVIDYIIERISMPWICGFVLGIVFEESRFIPFMMLPLNDVLAGICAFCIGIVSVYKISKRLMKLERLEKLLDNEDDFEP